jgi:hypothetical protein
MKKLATLLVLVATLASNNAFAQNSTKMGNGAQAASTSSSDNFAWGIGLGALAAVGVVVGVVAGTSASSASSFSH